MRNRPIFIKVKSFVDAQDYTIKQIQDIGYKDVKSFLNLSDKEFAQYRLYAPSIKHVLIGNIKERNKQEAMNVMVDKLLLSGSTITTKEAQLAAGKIFEDRNLKAVSK